MPRVVPSQIVALIHKFYANISDDDQFALNDTQLPQLTAILELIDRMPSEFLTLSAERFSLFMFSCQVLRTYAERYMGMDRRTASPGTPVVKKLRALDMKSPITFLRDCLADCPDEFPSEFTSELAFMELDSEYRGRLRVDMGSMEQALRNAEWKAATVLAGALLEALLLWAIQKKRQQSEAKSTEMLAWHLPDYIKEALELKLITPDTSKQCELAKDFRNLIHPGRAIRLNQECKRGTALSAVAAVELVVEDLSR